MDINRLLTGLGRLDGIKGGVVLDKNGAACFQTIDTDNVFFKVIADCANTFLSISTSQFKYAVFLRQNYTEVLIFPLGRHHIMGVVRDAAGKEKKADQIAGEILSMLTESNT